MYKRHKAVLQSTLVVGAGTLISRFLGMLRDSATAAILGMSAGGIMDSFVLAFRLPDLARRMFGEGTLSVSFIPHFAKLWNEDRQKAWSLVSYALFAMFWLLFSIVLIGELLCLIATLLFTPESKVYIAAQLTALMLPYLLLICSAAIATATLQTLGNFFVPSLIPMILNVIWLTGLLVLSPLLASTPLERCLLLGGCILFAGCIQFSVQLPFLRRAGFRFQRHWHDIREESKKMVHSFFPTLFGLLGPQINVLTITAIAWAFSGHAADPIRWIAWLGGRVHYPLEIGSTASIYFSERLYEFPQGLLGLAIAAVVYPLLSRHAAHLDFTALAEDLGFGLRLVFSLAIPATLGLMLLSEPLARLLYQRGAFTPTDMFRTADMIYWFSFGVCGFCSIPLLVRAFYVVGDIRTPVRIGLLCCLLNLILALILIWNMSERGLALATSLAATIQTGLLLVVFVAKHKLLNFAKILKAVFRSVIASVLMGLAIDLILDNVPGKSSISCIVQIGLACSIGGLVFLITFYILAMKDFDSFFSRKQKARPLPPKRKRS